MACSASATPAISHSTAGTGSGPRLATASVREGPGTYSVASQGGTPPSRRRHTHHAWDDAVEQAELFGDLMAWPGPGSPR